MSDMLYELVDPIGLGDCFWRPPNPDCHVNSVSGWRLKTRTITCDVLHLEFFSVSTFKGTALSEWSAYESKPSPLHSTNGQGRLSTPRTPAEAVDEHRRSIQQAGVQRPFESGLTPGIGVMDQPRQVTDPCLSMARTAIPRQPRTRSVVIDVAALQPTSMREIVTGVGPGEDHYEAGL